MSEVTIEKRGKLGVLTLNRPKAMNALNLDMCEILQTALDDFARDDSVAHVAVRSADNGRFFCAGGDIRAIYHLLKQGDVEEALRFFAVEYRLNRTIARYPKPYLAFIDGIVMGGGVGISTHGAAQIVSENAIFAMPEVAIGFFPDVGAVHRLARLTHNLGVYLAVTGARLGAGDMLAYGLATHHIPAAAFESTLEALSVSDATHQVLQQASAAPPPATLDNVVALIETLFAGATAKDIVTQLQHHTSAFAQECLATLAGRSPISMALACEQMRRVKGWAVEEVLQQDYRIACRILRGKDFMEGVRALLIDKDQKPYWSPATLDDVDPRAVQAYFELLPVGNDLKFAA